MKIEKEVFEVISKSEVVTIVSNGKHGPHLVATWGAFVEKNGLQDGNTILIPAGGYKQTQENLMENNQIQILAATKKVPGEKGSGTGYRLSGKARIEDQGEFFESVKTNFPWARAALIFVINDFQKIM